MKLNIQPTLRSAMLAMAALGAVTAFSAVKRAVVIHSYSGQEEVIALADAPRITYEGAEMHLNSASVSMQRQMTDVAKVTIEDRDISNVNEMLEHSMLFSYSDNVIECAGLTPGIAVSLYDTEGFSVANTVADANGSIRIDLNPMHAGIYLLSISNQKTYKIYKK